MRVLHRCTVITEVSDETVYLLVSLKERFVSKIDSYINYYFFCYINVTEISLYWDK